MRVCTLIALSSCLSLGHSFQPIQALGKRLVQAGGLTTLPTQVALVGVPKVSPPTSSSACAATSTAKSDSDWITKQVFNRNWFRSASLLVALFLSGASQKSPLALLPSKTSATIHLLSFSIWFGTLFYTTFIAGFTMFKNLPRQTFGRLQSKLFPQYFALSSITILLQILTLRSLPIEITRLVGGSLGTALFTTLVNQFYVVPYSSKIMLERYDIENTEGGTQTEEYKKLKSQFGKFHGLSSLMNLIAMCGAVIHSFTLSSLLLI